ncbi:MAG: hypothetical protein KJ052_13920 [Candidatus Hydrogenedentes bacterium]|nr:hypothetical protein [Candidatus Hydrogenedentota bacterium]
MQAGRLRYWNHSNVIDYAYNNRNQVTGVTAPGSRAWSVSYDRLFRLSLRLLSSLRLRISLTAESTESTKKRCLNLPFA